MATKQYLLHPGSWAAGGKRCVLALRVISKCQNAHQGKDMSDRGSASLHGNMVHLLPPTPVKIFRFALLNPCRKQRIGTNLVQATSWTGFSKTNF